MCSVLRSTVAVMLVPCVQAWAASWTTASAEMYCRSSVGWRVCHCKQLLGIPIDAHFFWRHLIWTWPKKKLCHQTLALWHLENWLTICHQTQHSLSFDQHLFACRSKRRGCPEPSARNNVTCVEKRVMSTAKRRCPFRQCSFAALAFCLLKDSRFWGRTGKNSSKRRLFPQRRDFAQIIFYDCQIWRESTKIFPATTVCWNWWGVSRTCSDGKHNAPVYCPLFPAHHMETFEQKMIIFIEISPKLICEDASLANSGLVSKGFQMSRN